MKRVLRKIRETRSGGKKPLREMKLSGSDVEALRDVQSQFDSLIEQMMDAKLLVAGISVGSDEVWIEKPSSSRQEGEEAE
jgi:hypothetical protein